MAFWKKTIRDIELEGKTVLVHSELDAPLTKDGKTITSDFRLQSSLPTINFLKQNNCKIILISKQGRPEGKREPTMSLRPVAGRLSELLEQEVKFVSDCIGDEVKKESKNLSGGGVLVLENVRFYPEENENDAEFANNIVSSTGAEVFVQDCFAIAHRSEASTDAIARILPAVAGLHLEKEITTIVDAIDNPARPLMAIVGGAKISDKIDVLKQFVDIADFVAVGGAMANTFLLAKGIKIGNSLAEPDEVELAREIMEKAEAKAKDKRFIFYIPQDGVVASSMDKNAKTRIIDWDAHIISSIENYPKQAPRASGEIADNESILDIGPFSGAFIAGGMQLASTVIWNGAMGVTETPGLNGPVGPFAHGTEMIVEAILGQYGNRPFSLVGGGDTVGYITERNLADKFDHVSTGGGASLDLMSGKVLPAVEVLQEKD